MNSLDWFEMLSQAISDIYVSLKDEECTLSKFERRLVKLALYILTIVRKREATRRDNWFGIR